jgi:hypothetical protein
MRTNLDGRGQLIRTCCGLLFLFFATALTAAPQHGSERAGSTSGGPPDAPQPTHDQVSHAIALSAGYLERACGPDGKFVYEININSGKKSNSYNIVRHAGAM